MKIIEIPASDFKSITLNFELINIYEKIISKIKRSNTSTYIYIDNITESAKDELKKQGYDIKYESGGFGDGSYVIYWNK